MRGKANVTGVSNGAFVQTFTGQDWSASTKAASKSFCKRLLVFFYKNVM